MEFIFWRTDPRWRLGYPVEAQENRCRRCPQYRAAASKHSSWDHHLRRCLPSLSPSCSVSLQISLDFGLVSCKYIFDQPQFPQVFIMQIRRFCTIRWSHSSHQKAPSSLHFTTFFKTSWDSQATSTWNTAPSILWCIMMCEKPNRMPNVLHFLTRVASIRSVGRWIESVISSTHCNVSKDTIFCFIQFSERATDPTQSTNAANSNNWLRTWGALWYVVTWR